MDKIEAVKIIIACAKEYHANLENKNFLFLHGHIDKPQFMETLFLSKHFMHLTGVETTDTFKGSVDFYNKCITNFLSTKDIELRADSTTEYKLSVLPRLMKVYINAKQIGEYSGVKNNLYTEKLAGNVTACMGFVRDKDLPNFYVPNTTLKEDIRDITRIPQSRILAVFEKEIEQRSYQKMSYLVQGIDADIIKTYIDIFNKKSLALQIEEVPQKDVSISRTKDGKKRPLNERIAAAHQLTKKNRALKTPELIKPTKEFER